jgi:hypothetical protein
VDWGTTLAPSDSWDMGKWTTRHNLTLKRSVRQHRNRLKR